MSDPLESAEAELPEAAGRHRLVIASNRGPVQFREAEGGALVARRGGGGLVTALGGLARHHDITWVAHAMSDADVAAMAEACEGLLEEVSRDGAPYRLRMVGEPDGTYQLHYSTISNPLLWFLHHRLYAFGDGPTIDRGTYAAWRAYREVNERIADAVVQQAGGDEPAGSDDSPPVAMVHDYHLFLVPGLVRRRRPDLFLTFFLHIPWPDPGAWRAFPRAWTREVTESLLACDIVGFQTHWDVSSFLRTCERFLGAQVDHDEGIVTYMGSKTWVRAYPISVAVEEFDGHVAAKAVTRYRERIRELRPADGWLIVRVDRTEPSKNIVRGFKAFSLLLHEHPELHGRVSMFCQLDPSRQDLPEYARYTERIETAAEQVNRAFASGGWQPVYVNMDSNFLAAVAAYTEYDVLFVNPVADGMNLVSKEGPLVNERDGVVVLSEQAGSFNELGPYAVPVNPFDVAQQADALFAALQMPVEERRARAERLQRQVRVHDVRRWVGDQLQDVERLAAEHRLSPR